MIDKDRVPADFLRVVRMKITSAQPFGPADRYLIVFPTSHGPAKPNHSGPAGTFYFYIQLESQEIKERWQNALAHGCQQIMPGGKRQ